ncbi:MAG: hypothetical protein A2161_03460 [Candidatus Schekmanbacteria bacterium RBG_13_48_7]|uniref:DUF3955 domain-containing protein n=1 Tax=Candidatus Schekmanbacteria bacterium RBG_13_48_7 TaxID=1817878 RepID=A0A1F7S9C1_9BACT|nr:MAG: hypothetical protein A2161_03460 [Candidatus Schekmanbacteria bacterium RBG_13_48_7]
MGTLKAQDLSKLLILTIVLLGSTLSLIFNWDIRSWVEHSTLLPGEGFKFFLFCILVGGGSILSILRMKISK